jgi:predicted transcriptional regulator
VTDPAPPPLHELETEVMERVWALGEATVHDVRDELNARSDKERAYTTVMTVMSRLCVKGMLKKERHGRRDHYVATLSRDEYLDARAESDVETLVAEYGDLALAHFAAHVAKLDPSRRRKLARLARRA